QCGIRPISKFHPGGPPVLKFWLLKPISDIPSSTEAPAMMTSLAFLFFAAMAQQQSACEGLKTLSLPHTTITTAEFRPAGAAQAGRGRGAGAQLPAHCRVAAVLA